jgi:hypothetical protein
MDDGFDSPEDKAPIRITLPRQESASDNRSKMKWKPNGVGNEDLDNMADDDMKITDVRRIFTMSTDQSGQSPMSNTQSIYPICAPSMSRSASDGGHSENEPDAATAGSADSATTTNERMLTPMLSRSMSVNSNNNCLSSVVVTPVSNVARPITPITPTEQSDRILAALSRLRQEMREGRLFLSNREEQNDALILKYEALLDNHAAQRELRDLVLAEGIPQFQSEKRAVSNALRTRIWKVFLGVTGTNFTETEYETRANVCINIFIFELIV